MGTQAGPPPRRKRFSYGLPGRGRRERECRRGDEREGQKGGEGGHKRRWRGSLPCPLSIPLPHDPAVLAFDHYKNKGLDHYKSSGFLTGPNQQLLRMSLNPYSRVVQCRIYKPVVRLIPESEPGGQGTTGTSEWCRQGHQGIGCGSNLRRPTKPIQGISS